MTTAEMIAVLCISDSVHRAQLRRAVIASTVGTTIERCDFLLYRTTMGAADTRTFGGTQ